MKEFEILTRLEQTKTKGIALINVLEQMLIEAISHYDDPILKATVSGLGLMANDITVAMENSFEEIFRHLRPKKN